MLYVLFTFVLHGDVSKQKTQWLKIVYLSFAWASSNTNVQINLKRSIHVPSMTVLCSRLLFWIVYFSLALRFYFIWHFELNFYLCAQRNEESFLPTSSCLCWSIESGSHNRVKCLHLNKVFTAGNAFCVIRCAKSKTATNWKIVRTQCATAIMQSGMVSLRFYLACLYLPKMSSYIFCMRCFTTSKLWHCCVSLRFESFSIAFRLY